jgi:hypothetical protein
VFNTPNSVEQSVMEASYKPQKLNTNDLGLGEVKSPNPDVEIKPGQDVLLTKNDASTNLASEQRTEHILHGDETGGGHMWPGQPNKTLFPQDWSEQKIMHNVSDIVSDPNLAWNRADGKTAMYYKSGKPARFTVIGERDGVKIKVVIEPAGEGIITAHPID